MTITNDNRHGLTISSVSASVAQFSFSGPTFPVHLNPGQSLTVSVTFKPSAAQAYSGALDIYAAQQFDNFRRPERDRHRQTSPSAVTPTITSQPASAKITAGQTATFNVAATGTAPMTYQWKKNGTAISGATSSTYTTPAETTADNNAAFTAEVSNTAGNATSNAAVLTVTSPIVAPAITTQPASQTVIAGKTASFTVAASGTAPLTYQWSKNGAAISGATSSTYTTPAETTTDNNAKFTVAVSNSAGSATSNAAMLTVSASTLLLNSSASSLSFGNVNVSSNGTQIRHAHERRQFQCHGFQRHRFRRGLQCQWRFLRTHFDSGTDGHLDGNVRPAAAGSVTGSVSVASNATNSPDSIALSGTGVATVNHSVALSWTPSTSTVIGYNTYSSSISGGPTRN